MKRSWNNPAISFDMDNPGDDNIVVGGTGQSATDPYPCTYKEWLILFADDYDLDEDIDHDDYLSWWEDNEFEGDPSDPNS